MRRPVLPLLLVLLVLLILAPSASVGAAEEAEAARERLIDALGPLVDSARTRGDRTAAQAVAEVLSVVSGAPHADLDALRRELRSQYAKDLADSAWIESALARATDDAEALLSSDDDLARRDGLLVKGLAGVLRAMRVLNTARHEAGLVPVRYDASRAGARAALALTFPAAGVASGVFVLAVRPEAAMRSALEALDARMALLDPPDKGAVIVTAEEGERVVTLIAISGNREIVYQGPWEAAWPPKGRADVPCRVAAPTPAALSEAGNAWGPWITLAFYEPGAAILLDAVTLKGVDGAEIRATYGTVRGARLVLPRVSDAVLIRPIEALAPGVRYTVRIKASVDGRALSREWTFETGG